jgi:hypothetical protein
MRNWLRVLGLSIALGLVSVAGHAWPPEYGTCYLYCEEGIYPLDFMTQWECCSELHYCPNESFPFAKVWNTYGEGGPQFCG